MWDLLLQMNESINFSVHKLESARLVGALPFFSSEKSIFPDLVLKTFPLESINFLLKELLILHGYQSQVIKNLIKYLNKYNSDFSREIIAVIATHQKNHNYRNLSKNNLQLELPTTITSANISEFSTIDVGYQFDVKNIDVLSPISVALSGTQRMLIKPLEIITIKKYHNLY